MLVCVCVQVCVITCVYAYVYAHVHVHGRQKSWQSVLLSRQFPSGLLRRSLSLSPELADSPACLTSELRDLLSAAPGLEFDTCCRHA